MVESRPDVTGILQRVHLDTVLTIGGNGSSRRKHKACNVCQPMEPEQKPKPIPRLADIENEVAAESREWGRRRLEERLQRLADEQSEVFPPAPKKVSKAHPAQRVRRGKTSR